LDARGESRAERRFDPQEEHVAGFRNPAMAMARNGGLGMAKAARMIVVEDDCARSEWRETLPSVPMARAETLARFPELVSRLGGDPVAMLRRVQIDPGVLDDPNGLIAFRAMVHLLENASVELDCPDFGIRLAIAQGPGKIFSPVGVAMRNSLTLRAALRYCVDNVHVYCNGLRVTFEAAERAEETFLRFDILLDRLPHRQQTLEYTLALMHNVIPQMSGGTSRVREIWFTHPPIAPLKSYRAHFRSKVAFGQPINGLLFDNRDLEVPVSNTDRQLYQLATSFIDGRFPRTNNTLSVHVRSIISRLLREEDCSLERVCAELGMHPRTLQRRLREEGHSFESMKDGLRRDTALQFLKRKQMPLIHVAEALGYAEVSTLSRSCYRWFSASPRQLRSRLCKGRQEETV
jgi:AraC-like DNA-binding protein